MCVINPNAKFLNLIICLLIIDLGLAVQPSEPDLIHSTIIHIGGIPSDVTKTQLEAINVKKDLFYKVLKLKYGDNFFEKVHLFLNEQDCNEGTNGLNIPYPYDYDLTKNQYDANNTSENQLQGIPKYKDDQCFLDSAKKNQSSNCFKVSYPTGTNWDTRGKANQILRLFFTRIKEFRSRKVVTTNVTIDLYRTDRKGMAALLSILDLCVDKCPDDYAVLFVDVIQFGNLSTPSVRFLYQNSMIDGSLFHVQACKYDCTVYDVLVQYSNYIYFHLSPRFKFFLDMFICLLAIIILAGIIIFMCVKGCLHEIYWFRRQYAYRNLYLDDLESLTYE